MCSVIQSSNINVRRSSLQIFVVLRQSSLLSFFHFALELILPSLVHLDLWRQESWHSYELQVGVSDKLACQPQEWLFEVVVGLGRDVVVLKILLAVENDALGFHFAVLDVDFVTAKDDRDVFADSNQIAMPVGNVFVGDARSDVKHNDSALALNVVSIAKSSELFLTSCVLKMKNNAH